jgi:hypothetical protein
LPLDERFVLPRQPVVLGPAHLVECLPQVPHHVELVEQDRRLGRIAFAELRNGFHISMTAILIPLLFLGPSHL